MANFKDVFPSRGYMMMSRSDIARMPFAPYSVNGHMFFLSGDETRVGTTTCWKWSAGEPVWIGQLKTGGLRSFISVPELKAQEPNGVDDSFDVYVVHSAGDNLFPNEPMPGLLYLYGRAPQMNDEPEQRNGRNLDANGNPTYYTEWPVRTEGIEFYDPKYRVDPEKVNVKGATGARKVVPYDDEGNPILDAPKPKARAPAPELRVANGLRVDIPADARAVNYVRDADGQIIGVNYMRGNVEFIPEPGPPVNREPFMFDYPRPDPILDPQAIDHPLDPLDALADRLRQNMEAQMIANRPMILDEEVQVMWLDEDDDEDDDGNDGWEEDDDDE